MRGKANAESVLCGCAQSSRSVGLTLLRQNMQTKLYCGSFAEANFFGSVRKSFRISHTTFIEIYLPRKTLEFYQRYCAVVLWKLTCESKSCSGSRQRPSCTRTLL